MIAHIVRLLRWACNIDGFLMGNGHLPFAWFSSYFVATLWYFVAFSGYLVAIMNATPGFYLWIVLLLSTTSRIRNG